MARRSNYELGVKGETLAVEFLENKGFEIIERNFRTRFSEIDIIAKDGDMLVFVEVKSRRSYRYGPAISAITLSKQRRIIQAAKVYIQQNYETFVACRFDIVAIHFEQGRPLISHLPHAFIEESPY